MLQLDFSKVRTILCLGAHADDIEIGCGGTILKLLAANPLIDVHWVVLSGSSQRAEEARESADRFLEDARQACVTTKEFRDSYFPYDGAAVKDFFHQLQQEVSPDLVFTHRREDMHQDHRLVAELTWNAFRNHVILEYEIPKYEGDLAAPNVFVSLTESLCKKKIATLGECFPSQQDKPWFSADTFWSLLRIRGLEANSATHYAEGLYCRKLAL